MSLDIAQQVLLSIFLISVVMGAVVHKTNFCTMGAVSDWVNMGDTARMKAWLLAMVVALLGVTALQYLDVFSLDSSRPPYRTSNFAWARYLLGGLLFGIGMTLASGCGNKTLVRIGGGNMKSVLVFLVVGIFAYLMTKTDFYSMVFHSWMQYLTIDFSQYDMAYQDLASVAQGLVGGMETDLYRLFLGLLLSFLGLAYVFKSSNFRLNFDNILGGVVVGAVVVAAWYATGGTLGQAWQEEAEFMDQVPLGVATQSFTFINPMGETLDYLSQAADNLYLTFGVVAVAGVIIGSFIYAVVSRNFRWEWFSSKEDFVTHMIGGVLMGVGGVLAMGCTIGQGVSGISTLSVGSFMAFGSIVLGSALTMKVQYYKMVYEDEATLGQAFVTGLVDIKLLPEWLRKLKAV